uniref:Putative glycosyltransferase n=1 Tax=viral metagenome TaxID=1070528 RepID=A0A6M3MAU0_9ZZZZ
MDEIISEYVDGVSIVIPTYNRCLYQNDESNPLMWCISSIKQQMFEGIEIIIVDDASNDMTYKKMKKLCSEDLKGIDIKYLRNEERKGSSISRNIGISLASNELVLFSDDDCIFMSKDALTSAVYSFKEKEREGNTMGAMHLSVYYRSNRFKDILPVKEILGIDYEKARIHCNTSSFPKELNDLKGDNYFKGTNILKPLEINNLAGAFLCKKQAYLDVDGFPDYFPTPSLGEEHKLAQRFTNSGYKLFFAPDPKSALLHFKYGRKDKEPVVPLDPLHDNAVESPLSLKDMVDESRHVRVDTGNAVTIEEGMYSYVFGRLMIFSCNDSSKRKFKERIKDEIIENNRYVYFNRKLNDRDLRERICLDAISAAETKSREMRVTA